MCCSLSYSKPSLSLGCHREVSSKHIYKGTYLPPCCEKWQVPTAFPSRLPFREPPWKDGATLYTSKRPVQDRLPQLRDPGAGSLLGDIAALLCPSKQGSTGLGGCSHGPHC